MDKQARDVPAEQSRQHKEMMSLLFLEWTGYGEVGN